MKAVLANWCLAGAAALMAGAAYNLDAPDNSSDEPAVRQIMAGERAKTALEDSQAADQRQCERDYGPNTAAVQLPNGDHICTDKRGRRLRNPIVVMR